MKKLFIVNPNANNGRLLPKWQKLVKHHPDLIKGNSVLISKSSQNTKDHLLDKSNGYEAIIAVGGDGTVSDLLTLLFSNNTLSDKLKFGILPLGTGNDGARNLQLSSLEKSIDAVLGNQFKKADVIRITFRGAENQTVVKYGFTLANVGFGASLFAMQHPWIKQYFGRKMAYYFSTLVPLLNYSPVQMNVKCDKGDYSGKNWMCIAANNEWAGGGGMRIAPGALINDGYLHLTIVPKMSILKLLRKLPKLRNGSHLSDPTLIFVKTRSLTINTDTVAAVEMDGDYLGTTPAEIKILPNAIDMIS